jgi:hypothetical protein
MKTQKITIQLVKHPFTLEVDAEIIGDLALHKEIDSTGKETNRRRWHITHVPSGRGIMPNGWHIHTKNHARKVMRILTARYGEAFALESAADLEAYAADHPEFPRAIKIALTMPESLLTDSADLD